MDASRWRQIRQLFDELAGHPAEQWREQLLVRCPDDPDLQRDVFAMLKADADEQTGPVVGLSAKAPALLDELVKDHEARALNEWIGRCLGPWRITALIGSGGMGLVYLAERVDGNFSQRAAIKVMRAGADTASVMRRFREERQILAGLAHPNIARLLDGGVDEQGVPWFAMEYVDGQPITDWCAARQLDVKTRLVLFLDVCAGIAHAHQHLVVHRDLKPQNVLVDPEGRAKLLDFGIAKLLDDADGSDHTGTAMRLMTPDYAAPEQIRGDPVTTAVDVYALGLLLFELLTGERPYRRKKHGTTLSTVNAVLHEEPRAPSIAIARAGTGMPDTLSSTPTAASPRTPSQTPGNAGRDAAKRLRQQLRGDLDAIVLKALRKEPERRYRSVAELAADVRAHLELRPVGARQGSRRYRASRFIRRHAGAVAFATLALFALVAGVAGTLRYAQIARQERVVAVAEARKARTTAGFLRQLFVSTNPAATDGEDPRASELLEKGRRDLANQDLDAETRASLLTEITFAYMSLDQLDRALETAEEADRAAGASGDTELRIRAAVALGGTLNRLSREQEALRQYDRARALYDASGLSDWQLDSDIDAFTATTLNNLHRTDESLALLERAFVKAEASDPEGDAQLGMLTVYAVALASAGRHQDAVEVTGRSYRRMDERTDMSYLDRSIVGAAYGHALLRAGRPELAEEPFRQALDFRERIYGEGHPATGTALHNVAIALRDQHKYREAATFSIKALELQRQLLPDDNPRVRSSSVSTGIIFSAAGRHREALELLQEPMADDAWLEDAIDRTIINGFLALVHSLRATGQHAQALQAAVSGLTYEAENLAGGELLPKWAALRLARAELETRLGQPLSDQSCRFLADPDALARLDESGRRRADRMVRRCDG